MNYKGVNHIALVTRDMDTTIRFWRDLLGMKLVAGIGKKGNRQYFFELTENMLIAFFEWPEAQPVPDKDAGRPLKGPIVFDHVCIELKDREHFWALKDRLNAAGVWATEIIDNGFIHSIFSTDPNGIQLEFCCGIKKYNVHDRLRMKDPLPTGAAQEGAGPFTDKWPEVKNPTPENERNIYPGELKKLFEGEE